MRKPDFATPARPNVAKRHNLSEEQKAELKEAFDLFDTEKRGRIDYHELKAQPTSLPALSPARAPRSRATAPFLPSLPHRSR
jgi:Ca2+-binding EF-hand superfamily protein